MFTISQKVRKIMIVIRVNTNVKPDKRSEFLKAIQDETPESQAFEGCVSYVWSENVQKPNEFALYEEWETLENLNAYKNSAHFDTMGKVLFPLFSEHPESSYYEAALLENA